MSKQESEPDYQEMNKLIAETRANGFRMLRFPKTLETSFSQYYREASLAQLPNMVVIASLLFGVVYGMSVMHIPYEELVEIINEPGGQGFGGSILINYFIVALFFVLAFLPRLKIIGRWQQYYLSLLTGIILSLALISYALVQDPRYQFIVEIVILLGYLLMYALVRLQTVFAFISSLLSVIIFIIFIPVLDMQPEWPKLVTLFISINLFGIIYSYINEYHERERFINMVEISAERQHLHQLNQATEDENELKAKLAKFYAVMRGEKNIHKLAEKIIQSLVPESNSNVASLYHLANNELVLLSQYGVSSKQQPRQRLQLGETLVGQAAVQKEIIEIDKAPEDFSIIQSGLGTINAPALTVIPMLFDQEVIVVLELASLKPLSAKNMEFLDQAGRSIATAINAVYAQSLQKKSA